MEDSNGILINVTADPVRREFVSYVIKRKETLGRELFELFKIEYVFYPHPDAPEHASIQRLERNFVTDISESHKLYEICRINYLSEASIRKNIV